MLLLITMYVVDHSRCFMYWWTREGKRPMQGSPRWKSFFAWVLRNQAELTKKSLYYSTRRVYHSWPRRNLSKIGSRANRQPAPPPWNGQVFVSSSSFTLRRQMIAAYCLWWTTTLGRFLPLWKGGQARGDGVQDQRLRAESSVPRELKQWTPRCYGRCLRP